MKVRKTLLVAAAGWAGLAAQAGAQIPVPPVPAPVGAPVAPTTPAPPTFWSKLGLSKEQKDKCKRELCATPLGQLINNSKAPLTLLSGGLIPPFCPTTPSAAQLADPGAEGAAAAIMLDEAGAKARRAAVRYLGTVDCHYWPEAGDALIAALRGDRNECVRWEAAMALGRGCCCTKKTIEALTIVVSCSDRDGAPKETSNRVHAAAGAALDHCLACYANVSTVPVQGEKPIERTTPPVETIPPPAPEPATAKAINPGEAKPAAGLTPVTPPPVVVQRPIGPAYYARVAKAPLAAILAEARRVAEKLHNTPMIADTPFETQGHSIAALMSYATGPDTQVVIPAGMSVPANEVRAEVVSAKPANLWDLLSKPNDEGQVAVGKTEMVVVQPPPPPKSAVVKREVVVPKPETTMKRETVVPKPAPVVIKPEPVVTKSEPVVRKLTLTPPMPAPAPMPMPKPEPLTLDFPPPAVAFSSPAIDYPPAPMPTEGQPAGPSPYFATAATPTIANGPSEPIPSAVSSYHATAKTAAPRAPMPMDAPVTGPSPYFATAATPTITNRPSEPIPSAVSSYHATAATAPATTPMPVVKSVPSPSPYNGVASAAPAKPTPAPVAKTAPVPVAKAAPAPLPTPTAMPSTPMSTKPMPAPAAPVVPAATVPSVVPAPAPAAVRPAQANSEMVVHLLKMAKGDGPVEVRKTSIQELAKLKANTPEVMAALDGLSDDPVPGVRAEAIIAAARLRLGR